MIQIDQINGILLIRDKKNPLIPLRKYPGHYFKKAWLGINKEFKTLNSLSLMFQSKLFILFTKVKLYTFTSLNYLASKLIDSSLY